MRKLTIILGIGLAISLFATPVQAQAQKESAIITGSVLCFENPDTAVLDIASLTLIGVSISPEFAMLRFERLGTCAEARAEVVAQLPSPLCNTADEPSFPDALKFVCSGRAGEVVQTVGSMMKAMMGN